MANEEVQGLGLWSIDGTSYLHPSFRAKEIQLHGEALAKRRGVIRAHLLWNGPPLTNFGNLYSTWGIPWDNPWNGALAERMAYPNNIVIQRRNRRDDATHDQGIPQGAGRKKKKPKPDRNNIWCIGDRCSLDPGYRELEQKTFGLKTAMLRHIERKAYEHGAPSGPYDDIYHVYNIRYDDYAGLLAERTAFQPTIVDERRKRRNYENQHNGNPPPGGWGGDPWTEQGDEIEGGARSYQFNPSSGNWMGGYLSRKYKLR